ncbi:MAG: hypothetical protein PVI97_00105 [Candidatus Thiodiazotropha sp.]|jgi:hypothetical protein
MMYAIDMKRLHQGCGEPLQSKLPGISLIRYAQLPGLSQGQRRALVGFKSKNRQPPDESETK